MRTLYLIRGVPGTGKSTLADTLTPYNCAADDWMVDGDGNYSFNPARLSECHKACQDKILSFMMKGCSRIAVHNTFMKRWEAEPYFRLAREHGYTVCVIECQTVFGNVHGVPDETVNRIGKNWEDLSGL